MLKGVNRQVVEISEPESIYFERVLFFVKPEFYGLGESKLKKKADELMSTTVKLPRMREKRCRTVRVLGIVKLAVAVIAGGFAGAIITIAIR